LSVEVNVEVTSTVTVAVTLGVGIFRQLQAAEISQLGKDLSAGGRESAEPSGYA
jgi:hypothetical protein